MPIKNYTTTIKAEKTISEIQALLVQGGASAVLTDYKETVPVSVSFKLPAAHGMMAFRLPSNVEGVHACLARQPEVPKRLKTEEQAARVAWRIVKDWIAAQLAIVEAEMVQMEEVFLPYAQGPDGKTFYEKFKEQPAQFLLCKE